MLFSKFDITRRGASTIGEFKRRGRRGKKYCNYARIITATLSEISRLNFLFSRIAFKDPRYFIHIYPSNMTNWLAQKSPPDPHKKTVTKPQCFSSTKVNSTVISYECFDLGVTEVGRNGNLSRAMQHVYSRYSLRFPAFYPASLPETGRAPCM